MRIQIKDFKYCEDMLKQYNNFIIVSWHTRLFSLFFLRNIYKIKNIKKYSQHFALISPHTKNDIMSLAIKAFGYKLIKGSTHKKPVSTLKKLINILNNENAILVMTPDGSRGPLMKLKPALIALSWQTKAPILPYHVSFSKAIILKKRWDKMMIPLPFSKMIVKFNKPYLYKGKDLNKAKLKSKTLKLEKIMQQTVKEVDISANQNIYS